MISFRAQLDQKSPLDEIVREKCEKVRGLICASDTQAISPPSLDGSKQADSQAPQRPIYRKLAISTADARANGYELIALLVEMDLPELAIEMVQTSQCLSSSKFG
ncbi:hypothetical protein [Rhodopirellula sp. MGV]|uniref:hypothetical protein n=1 Tax=Rhodopirellula sp. MGV TaxID=2023130 RepID=UPI000B9695BD|nr:hypothetical protein [Rhodopirellula sp. MGV]OYP28500.1 hypothetical protein CGZ80_27250 [Rhodopirellula sp. MGV]PNY38622.1 hypothetical protein C2E31_01520 [Rhodopirellula baltica]